MIIDQAAGRTPRTTDITREIGALQGRCMGCPGCTGSCLALIEMMTLPDSILRREVAR
jgi:heterodisulfide reductase subunit C